MEMVTEETIVCNYPAYVGEDVKRLNLFGTDTVNVFPQISLFKEYFKNINPRLIDFVEIATFIYVADQMIVRCQNRVDPHGFLWRRKFNMVVAVQDYDFWCRADVTKTLERLLRFLSDDCFHFQFVKMTEKHPEQEYFIFDQVMGSARPPQRVMLFSGGLDSLGGAIQSLLGEGLQTVLVRHKAIRKHKARFAKLERELTKRSGNRGKFITFKAGKDGSLTKEYTQRSRSLLYFAFGATIAHLLGLKELLFFENGPVSFNLPMSPQVVGARATRTTHPQTLFFFQELIRKVSDIPDFIVRNPFLNMKKSEIVSLIISHNCGDLIKESMSCAHSWQQDKESKHCGTCSQCIDRRVAIIAAGAENYDNLKDYRVDFFTESVDKNHIDCFEAPNKNLLASFFLKGAQIEAYQNYEQFEQAFPEICDALLYMDKEAKFSAQEIYRLNRSLADDIRKVAQYATSEKFQIRMRDINNPLPTDCLCYILTRPSGTIIHTGQQPPVPEPDYVFYQCGESWRLRFEGRKENILQDYAGCHYIAMLLANPNQCLEYSSLILTDPIDTSPKIDGDELANSMTITRKENYDPTMDHKYLKDCYRTRDDLQARLDNNNFSSETERQEIQDEIDEINQILQSSLKKGGKARNQNLEEKRQQDRVRRAINTVIEKMDRFAPEMATYLKEHIRLGSSPTYHCENPPIQWKTT